MCKHRLWLIPSVLPLHRMISHKFYKMPQIVCTSVCSVEVCMSKPDNHPVMGEEVIVRF